MKVTLDLEHLQTDLGSNGLILRISGNDGKHRGNLRIGKATVEWCPGKTRIGNGHKLKLEEFLAKLDS